MRAHLLILVVLGLAALMLAAGCGRDTITQPEPLTLTPNLTVDIDEPTVNGGEGDDEVTVDIDEPTGTEDDDDEVTVDIDEPT